MKKTIVASVILGSIISMPAIAAKKSFDFNSYMPVKKGELQKIIAPINEAIQANTTAIDNLSVTVEANSITATENSSIIEQNTTIITDLQSNTPNLDIINAPDYFASNLNKVTYKYTSNNGVSNYGEMELIRIEKQDEKGPTVSWQFHLPFVDSNGNQTAYLDGDTLFRVVDNSLNVVSGSSSYNGGAVTTKTYSPEIVRMKNGSIVGMYTGGTTVETTGNTSKSLTYTVLPILKGSITVPAGTFDNCILAKYENDPQTRTVWSCPGKGRVKWENEAGTWELTSFE